MALEDSIQIVHFEHGQFEEMAEAKADEQGECVAAIETWLPSTSGLYPNYPIQKVAFT